MGLYFYAYILVMQTFLPFRDFKESASSLDSRRLNKQILEGYQLLKVLNNHDPHAAWRNHPAGLMWKGSEHVLWDYIWVMIKEAEERGIRTEKNKENLLAIYDENWSASLPSWFTDEKQIKKVEVTHRANLYLKEPESYGEFRKFVEDKNNTPCCDTCKYYWPTHPLRKEKETSRS